MSTTIEILRAQCRIDSDDSTEDEMLLIYFGSAKRKAENFINRKLYETEVPESDPDGLLIENDVLLALLLLSGHWYENREQVNVGNIVTSFPFGFESLLEPYRYIPL
ncbi:head-tail connector protein [Phytobacter sp. V91]|uniref:head-tail connector protein n=1 Tax=Phytobacter sp. V91 TaxID=3369425 RepID=UPI003F635422